MLAAVAAQVRSWLTTVRWNSASTSIQRLAPARVSSGAANQVAIASASAGSRSAAAAMVSWVLRAMRVATICPTSVRAPCQSVSCRRCARCMCASASSRRPCASATSAPLRNQREHSTIGCQFMSGASKVKAGGSSSSNSNGPATRLSQRSPMAP
ncbi:MAG: hypothetical protein U1F25_13930 [Rubrivivax sp.]